MALSNGFILARLDRKSRYCKVSRLPGRTFIYQEYQERSHLLRKSWRSCQISLFHILSPRSSLFASTPLAVHCTRSWMGNTGIPSWDWAMHGGHELGKLGNCFVVGTVRLFCILAFSLLALEMIFPLFLFFPLYVFGEISLFTCHERQYGWEAGKIGKRSHLRSICMT